MTIHAKMRQALDRATASDFSVFLRRVMASTAPGVSYAHNWHIDAIAEHLHACARGEITRLVINLPPRMLKSTLVSVAWPAWLLAQNPSARIMAASYAQGLANKLSTDCRVVLQSPWYRRVFPATVLSHDQNEKDKFVTTARGHRIAVSVGGAAIGEGGNYLIVDDPLNPLQAAYQAQRDAVNAWFEHTFATRLDDKRHGAIVVVMQRLHAEDLSGHLLAKGGWQHLCLPAIAEQRSTIRIGGFTHVREAGSVLHEAREPMEILNRTQQELGSANFSAQYQQQPFVLQGSMIKPHWIARFDDDGHETCVQSWDTAVKAGMQHDASACATFTVKDGIHRLVDMLKVRLEYPELKRLIVSHAARFSPEAILIEDKASGQSLLQDLRRETDLPLLARQPKGDKLARIIRVSPLLEAGKLALPKHAPWLAALEEQLFKFPDGAHDDMVDAISQYLNWRREQMHISAPGIRRL